MKMAFKNQSGQMTIEAVLIMTILSSIALLVMKTAKQENFAAALIEKPWKPLQGMIEDGVWQDAGKSKANHPSLRVRHHSNQGDEVPTN